MKNVLLVIKFAKCISFATMAGVLTVMSGCICVCMDDLSEHKPVTTVHKLDSSWDVSVRGCNNLSLDCRSEDIIQCIKSRLNMAGHNYEGGIENDQTQIEVCIKDCSIEQREEHVALGLCSLTLFPVWDSKIQKLVVEISAEGCCKQCEVVLKKTQLVSLLSPLAMVPMIWHEKGILDYTNPGCFNSQVGKWVSNVIADSACALIDKSFCEEVLAAKWMRLEGERRRRDMEAEESARREAERAAEQERKKEQEEAVKREKERKRNKFVSEMRSRHNCSVSTSRLGSVRPTSGTAYPHDGGFYGSFKVFQCIDSGVLVRNDETIYFVETTDTYVDGDELKEGWYKCMGTYQYVTAFGGNKTVFKFCPVSASYGSDIISDIDGQRFAEEFSRALLGF